MSETPGSSKRVDVSLDRKSSDNPTRIVHVSVDNAHEGFFEEPEVDQFVSSKSPVGERRQGLSSIRPYIRVFFKAGQPAYRSFH